MNRSKLLIALLAVSSSAFAADMISYEKLVESSLGDASPKDAFGKSVQVGITGKGDIGYFAKKADAVTFVCASGDKSLTANKPAKGRIQGVLSKAQGWDGATVWTLKDCQFVAAGAAAVAVPAQSTAAVASKRTYQAGNKSWSGVVELVGDDRKATVSLEADSQGGTCSVAGAAVYSSPSRADFKASNDASCTAELVIASEVLKVKTKGCESYCGARGPGFDHTYALKR